MKINILKLIQTITAILEKTSPALANKWAVKLFFSPRTSKQRIPDLPSMQQSWCTYKKIDGRESKCRVYSAGTGPTVLLVHGWAGSAWSMSAIAKQLLAKNLRVVLADLPAHGFSPGKDTNIVEVSSVIQKLAAQEEHLLAVVSHSFGAACSGHAIKSGITPDHFISIGAPTSMEFIFDNFCSTIGASDKIKQALIDHVEAILKAPYESESLTSIASQFKAQGMIIHDLNDRLVPYQQAQDFAAVWTDARLITTEKLGHNRMLINKNVIETITDRLVPA